MLWGPQSRAARSTSTLAGRVPQAGFLAPLQVSRFWTLTFLTRTWRPNQAAFHRECFIEARWREYRLPAGLVGFKTTPAIPLSRTVHLPVLANSLENVQRSLAKGHPRMHHAEKRGWLARQNHALQEDTEVASRGGLSHARRKSQTSMSLVGTKLTESGPSCRAPRGMAVIS